MKLHETKWLRFNNYGYTELSVTKTLMFLIKQMP